MGTWTIGTWATDRILKQADNDWPYIWGRYCMRDRYFVQEGSPTSAGNLEWFVRTFLSGMPDCYHQADLMISSLPKASTGIQFPPYLFACNLGNDLSARLYGLANAHGLGEVLQAVYEGICFSQHVLSRADRQAVRARPDIAPHRRSDTVEALDADGCQHLGNACRRGHARRAVRLPRRSHSRRRRHRSIQGLRRGHGRHVPSRHLSNRMPGASPTIAKNTRPSAAWRKRCHPVRRTVTRPPDGLVRTTEVDGQPILLI